MDDGEELALKELLKDMERLVRFQTYVQAVLLTALVFTLGALLGIYLKLDAWQFASKVMG